MHSGNSVIIHSSPVIQQGFKNILLARGIGISDVLHALPDGITISSWKDILVLADVKYEDILNKYAKTLSKNRNLVVGIVIGCQEVSNGHIFSDMITPESSMDDISGVLSSYLSHVSELKSDNQLSVRETEVLTMVAQGFSNKQIAGKLFISIHTVISHRKNITSKLGVKSISGLTLYAALNNLVDFQR
jgi:DNA-binding CsgD family transcriptional regulator